MFLSHHLNGTNSPSLHLTLSLLSLSIPSLSLSLPIPLFPSPLSPPLFHLPFSPLFSLPPFLLSLPFSLNPARRSGGALWASPVGTGVAPAENWIWCILSKKKSGIWWEILVTFVKNRPILIMLTPLPLAKHFTLNVFCLPVMLSLSVAVTSAFASISNLHASSQPASTRRHSNHSLRLRHHYHLHQQHEESISVEFQYSTITNF